MAFFQMEKRKKIPMNPVKEKLEEHPLSVMVL